MIENNENRFNDKQLQAIDLLARAEYEGLTQQQIALEVGVADRTIRRWLNNPRFKEAVGRKSLELITELSPMVFKATADFLQSKDDRVRTKGVDTFMKASEKIEALKKQDEQKKEEVDVDAFLESLGVESFENAKNKQSYLKKYIKQDKETVKTLVNIILFNEYRLQKLQEGCPIDEVYNLSNTYKESPEAVVGLLYDMFDVLEVPRVEEEIEEAEEEIKEAED